MRLTIQQKSAIIEVLQELIQCSYQLYLYGSRTDDTQRGGDIDLLLLLTNQSDRPSVEKIRYKILTKIKSKIGDQKIDLVIFTRSQLGQEPFLDSILTDGLLLE